MKKINAPTIICVLSLFIILFLIWFIYGKDPAVKNVTWVSSLSSVNASLNTLTSIFLISGFLAIRNKNKLLHIRLMLSAVFTSALFLISYLVYHHYQGDTKFLGVGFIRPIYFFILISHIVFSVVQVPLILLTLFYAWKESFDRHKKLARWTFPIWLYVSVTGVAVYFFIQLTTPLP